MQVCYTIKAARSPMTIVRKSFPEAFAILSAFAGKGKDEVAIRGQYRFQEQIHGSVRVSAGHDRARSCCAF